MGGGRECFITDKLYWVLNYAEYFHHIILFNPHSNHQVGTLIIYRLQMRNLRHTERLNKLPKVTQANN